MVKTLHFQCRVVYFGKWACVQSVTGIKKEVKSAKKNGIVSGGANGSAKKSGIVIESGKNVIAIVNENAKNVGIVKGLKSMNVKQQKMPPKQSALRA